MSGLGIRKYYGEFFMNPFALHADLPRCGYNCAYCFVNEQRFKSSDKTDTENKIPKTKAAWRTYLKTRTGILGELIRQKKVVVLSNTSDFFSPKVFEESTDFVEAMMDEGLPMFYQTRGGPKALEWAKRSPRASWCVSITSDDKTLTGEVESITPAPPARRKFCEELRALGHRVTMSVNPYIPQWWRDLPGALRWAEAIGVTGISIQALHLSSLYKNKIDADTLRRVTPILQQGRLSKKQIRERYAQHEKIFAGTKIPIFSGFASDYAFIRNEESSYAAKHLIPTMYHFFEMFPVGAEIKKDDFVNYFSERLPDCIDRSAAEYIKVHARAGFRVSDEEKFVISNMKEAMEVAWNWPWKVWSKPWSTQFMACRCKIDKEGLMQYDLDESNDVVGIRTRHHAPFEFVPGLHDANAITEITD